MKQFCKKDFTSYNLCVILKMKNIKKLICKILCVVEIPAQKKKGCYCNPRKKIELLNSYWCLLMKTIVPVF